MAAASSVDSVGFGETANGPQYVITACISVSREARQMPKTTTFPGSLLSA